MAAASACWWSDCLRSGARLHRLLIVLALGDFVEVLLCLVPRLLLRLALVCLFAKLTFKRCWADSGFVGALRSSWRQAAVGEIFSLRHFDVYWMKGGSSSLPRSAAAVLARLRVFWWRLPRLRSLSSRLFAPRALLQRFPMRFELLAIDGAIFFLQPNPSSRRLHGSKNWRWRPVGIANLLTIS